MGNYNRDDRGGDRGGRGYGGSRGGFGGGRSGGFRGDRPRPSFGGPRRSFGGPRESGDREMFKTVCSNCGKECEVPFRPTSGKPVYCSDCFEKMGGRESSGRPERSDFRPRPAVSDNKAQFEALSTKLDRIISLLESKAEKTVFVAPIEEEIKTPKAKKVVKKAASKE